MTISESNVHLLGSLDNSESIIRSKRGLITIVYTRKMLLEAPILEDGLAKKLFQHAHGDIGSKKHNTYLLLAPIPLAISPQ